MESEATVQRKDENTMPTDFGEFHAVSYHDDISGAVHLALTKGDIQAVKPTLVRVHVQQTILDAFTDAHRSRSWTLNEALHHVSEEGHGVVVILDQAAEPSVLLNQLERFSISGSVEAPRKPAIRDEMRTYGLGSQILADLGVGKMRVMGHAIKTPGMSGFGLEPVEYLETSHVDQQINNKKQAG
jgi:3,4-dihydroxy 2-butanone 4-phosphate synthase/GTP cyclohydrolase II